MPRIEFNDLKQAELWIKDKVIDSNRGYDAYFNVAADELTLAPTKSTPPILYGFIKFIRKKDAIDFFKNTSIKIYECSTFEWDSSHAPVRS